MKLKVQWISAFVVPFLLVCICTYWYYWSGDGIFWNKEFSGSDILLLSQNEQQRYKLTPNVENLNSNFLPLEQDSSKKHWIAIRLRLAEGQSFAAWEVPAGGQMFLVRDIAGFPELHSGKNYGTPLPRIIAYGGDIFTGTTNFFETIHAVRRTSNWSVVNGAMNVHRFDLTPQRMSISSAPAFDGWKAEVTIQNKSNPTDDLFSQKWELSLGSQTTVELSKLGVTPRDLRILLTSPTGKPYIFSLTCNGIEDEYKLNIIPSNCQSEPKMFDHHTGISTFPQGSSCYN